MKKIISLLSLGFLMLQSFTILPGELSKEERKAGVAYFKETGDYFTSRVKGLSDAQLDYKTAPDQWSVRQCMEHIALTESFLFTLVENMVKQTANPEKRAEIKFSDDDLKASLVDRSKKGQAPEPIKPTGKFKTADEATAAFLEARNRNIQYIETTKDDLRNHLTPHPFFGMLDSYQWLILLAGHTKRHTIQIEEVMASPGFPKS